MIPRTRRRSRHHSLIRIATAFVMLTGLLVVTQLGADAAHVGTPFELDGDAVTTAADPANEDWDKVCTPADDLGCSGGHTADVAEFITDGDKQTIFTTGGSKDDLDTTNWKHTNGNVPDKNDMQHAFAARYTDDHDSDPTTPDRVYLYFGADRIANNGDSQIGFWFFQDNVAPQADGTFGPGAHVDGDILVLSDFTQGGTKPTVRVFRWNGPGGDIADPGSINGTLDLLAGTTAFPQDCQDATISVNDPFCATVNTEVEPSPWAFTPKNAPANFFQPGELYEGGIDLTALGLENECFSSVLAETRSSQSVDAQLKDFVSGTFSVCEPVISSVPSAGSGGEVTPGTAVTDTVSITGQGVEDPPAPTGDVTFYLCGPIASGTCDPTSTGATQVGTAKTLSDPDDDGTSTATSDAVDTTSFTPGRYCFAIVWPGDSTYTGGPFTHGGTGDEECFTVAKIPTSTTTTPVVDDDDDPTTQPVASTSIALGDSIADQAVVTGTAAGGDPTGTVTTFVCTPSELDDATDPADDPNTCDVGGTQVGSAVALVGNSDNTSTAVSAFYTPTVVGTHCFRGEYSGSTVYLASSDSATTECFTVTDLSSISSAQDWLPNDTATITTTGGSNINGSLVFTLHDSSDCTGTVLYTEPTITITDDPSGTSYSTTNTTVKVTATDTVSWKATFTSSDTTAGSTHCEVTSLTINNNNS